MDRGDVSWHGYWPAAPTPFTADGRLDLDALTATMELYATHGVHGVLVNGSSGEWFAQRIDERAAVARTAVEAVAGRFPVVVGVSAYTAAEASALARQAAAVGADGVLATAPPYAHLDAEEVLAFYAEVSSATDLPFMVYNWPRGVSVDLDASPGLVQRLADLPHVAAVKDSTGDWLAMLSTVEAVSAQVRVFGSFLHRRGLAVLLGLGGDGNIDGGGVGAPFGVPFYEAVTARDAASAAAWADRYQRLSGGLIRADYSGRFASPVPQLKAAMAHLGQPGGHVRAPLLPLTDPARLDALHAVVDASGVREAGAALQQGQQAQQGLSWRPGPGERGDRDA